jgi:hypothetical protein
MWLAVSFEPLNAKEVTAVVSFRAPEFILKICTTLLATITDEDTTQITKLSHFSVKKFLVIKLCVRNSWQ